MDIKIDINRLTKDELIELNKLIFNRIKYLNDLESIKRRSLFNKGDFVSFEYDNKYILGIITKINIKTVSILTENGKEWRVSPSLLKKAIKSNASALT
ncbi:MAG: hypothetical protein GY830_09835 [Bacteroidetes bacterium]|nr:hypothetical protein [Bacteroidota bacterium]